MALAGRSDEVAGRGRVVRAGRPTWGGARLTDEDYADLPAPAPVGRPHPRDPELAHPAVHPLQRPRAGHRARRARAGALGRARRARDGGLARPDDPGRRHVPPQAAHPGVQLRAAPPGRPAADPARPHRPAHDHRAAAPHPGGRGAASRCRGG